MNYNVIEFTASKKNILNFNMYLFDIDANVTMLDQWADTGSWNDQ